MKKVLVTGGAGYIGSHMVKALLAAEYHPVILDNLSSGSPSAVLGGEFVRGDLADQQLLDDLFTASKFAGVMHFASFINVGESVEQPLKYYRNNFLNTLNLLECMFRHNANNFIFSSSAAIFGNPLRTPIDESHPVAPINPYGQSKSMVETALADFDRAYGLRSVSLRYFNAAGADPDGELGERHAPETHLIPLALGAASGRLPALKIFGRDYDTPDGTCIRDYVHTFDLCQAHLLALEFLLQGGRSSAFNLGSGGGYSVQEVISVAESVTGGKIPVSVAPRRPGDPVRLVADSRLIAGSLGWRPRYGDLETIIRHAWRWEQRLLAEAGGGPSAADHSGKAQ